MVIRPTKPLEAKVYEIVFELDALINKITVSAPDDETALFVAGMHFTVEDFNPERVLVVSIERVPE